MRTADDIFPRTPRPGPHFNWRAATGFLSAACLLIGQFVLVERYELVSGDGLFDEIMLTASKVLAGFGLLALAVVGWLIVQWSHSRVWRHGRIEPAVLVATSPTVWWRRYPYRAWKFLVGWLPNFVGAMFTSSYTTVELLTIGRGRVRRRFVRSPTYNFKSHGNPEVVWIVFPRGWPSKPRLLADVAPRDWAGLGAPPDVSVALMDEVARTQSRPKALTDTERMMDYK
jgi:hypothetical protein